MFSKTLIVLLVCMAPVVLCKNKRIARLKTDALSKTRCDLTCNDINKEARSQCRSKCRNQEEKPGTCPVEDTPKWAAACVEACTLDSQCDGIQRCCHHACSSRCTEPIDLLTLPGLPAMPVLQEPKEKKRAVIIQWSDGVGDAARAVPGRVLYLLEEQHHLGPKYEEQRLGEWNLLLRTNKTKATLKNLLKPGRWYRFRVAAVSSSGTRGFSQPSSPFTARRGPHPPPPPRKLKVKQLATDSGSAAIRLEWREPRSDLPVMRYKVYWSRRVRGVTGDLDSVLVNHHTVPKDQNYLEIRDLQPNAMYFMQVQTISQFGLGKLRSEKASIFYNTTSGGSGERPEQSAPVALQRRDKKIKDLKLLSIVWHNDKLKAKISWEAPTTERNKRYFVHWKSIKCEKGINQTKQLSAVTEQTTFEIYELDYLCSYKVNVNKSRSSKAQDSELIVSVPGCEYFKQKANNSPEIDCPNK